MPEPQTVLVTGAAQGLGQAVARAFHHAGWQVALLDIDESGLSTLQRGLGERVRSYTVDLSDAESTQRTAQRVVSDFGSIHTLVHNAAILVPEPLETLAFARWQKTLNVGVQAAFLLTQAVWEGMKTHGGSLIYVSSRSGIEGFANESAYCATKHALEGLMKCVALEGAPHGILAYTVTPGMYMRTPMSERNYTDDLKTKWVDPEKLTPAFLHLASRTDTALTGQRLSAWELSQG
jgi:3-hydroxybutyrate dehydrogenase